MVRIWLVFILASILLCSCSSPQTVAEAISQVPVASSSAESRIPDKPAISDTKPVAVENKKTYVQAAIKQLADELGIKSADGEEAIRKAYRYLIENIYFADPVGLDIWRYLSDEQKAIPYIENRSISPLLFKIGSCEDFAAVIVLLLDAAGFEARYVAGYTLSVDMVYIDHAWAVVKLDGLWYHLDPQLEQNVLKNNLLTYRYYLKSDNDMQIDHKWGENLIAYWNDMPEYEKENIRSNYLLPQCGESYPKPPEVNVRKPLKPNMADIEFQITQIIKQSGKTQLTPILLNVEPPVLVRAHHITPPLLKRQSELYEKMSGIIAQIPEGSTEFEKAAFIHDYLAINVEYDKMDTGTDSGSAYGALIENMANCNGYSQAFMLLCTESGLESMYITGKSRRGVSHAWNAVLIDGLWYYVDVTWDRPQRPEDGVYHDYFLLGYDEFSVDHIPDEGQTLAPACSSPGMGYYERKGYFVRDTQNLTQALAEAFLKQLEDIGEHYDFSGIPEPVFLEIKVLGDKQNYYTFKEHYIKNAFNILKEMQKLARERSNAFQIAADASVRCDFSDNTQVLTFYPNIQRLK